MKRLLIVSSLVVCAPLLFLYFQSLHQPTSNSLDQDTNDRIMIETNDSIRSHSADDKTSDQLASTQLLLIFSIIANVFLLVLYLRTARLEPPIHWK